MKKLIVFAGLLTAFLITACGYETIDYPPTVSTALRGTWKSNDPSVYNGTLTISISSTTQRITINGYTADQTPSILYGGDDNKRPFKDYTRGAALKFRWESEESKIDGNLEGILYITDQGKEQEGIPFVYYEGKKWTTEDYEKGVNKYLSFTFGGRKEILENSQNK